MYLKTKVQCKKIKVNLDNLISSIQLTFIKHIPYTLYWANLKHMDICYTRAVHGFVEETKT